MNLLSLSAELKKPLLYEKSPYPFWNDEHISKGMLEAHLAANWDAASRRASFMDASVAWIAETIPPTTYPRLLDLGCGPGLYAERFEQAGYAVTGVDVSARSIAYAKQAAQEDDRKAVFYVADYLLLDLHSSFDFATLIYCDYGALSTEDRAELLRRAAHHLRPGGRFLLDVSTVHAFEQFQETQYWALCREGGYWEEKPYFSLERKQRFCDNVTLHEAHILTDAQWKTHYIWHTYFTLERMQKEAKATGFSLVGYWGDVAGTPYSETSDTVALLFEKLKEEQ